MSVKEMKALRASGSEAVDALVARCRQAAEAGNDAESRAYLSGIFEVLADEQREQLFLRLSA